MMLFKSFAVYTFFGRLQIFGDINKKMFIIDFFDI